MDFEMDNRQRILDLERKVEFLLLELGLREKAEMYAHEQGPNLAEVFALVRQNRKIEAIKLYRQLTGTGLREAKAAVDRLS